MVSRNPAVLGLMVAALSICPLLPSQEPNKQELDRQYQTAVSDYEAGKYPEAAALLEKVLPYATDSAVVHELLGLVYASLSQTQKALDQLKLAAQLNPTWAEARANLGTALLKSGKAALAGEQFRKALQLEPNSYDSLHNLGEYYIETGKLADAVPLLERAHELNPSAYDNSFDLATAEFQLGRLAEARQIVLELVKQKDAGELHNLLGQIDEKDGKYVEAVNDFETAAHLEPSEDNLFDWGSELLLHRTYEPAITVFREAAKRYPSSPRLLIGLGLALYSRGIYDEAVQVLLTAAGLNPSDPRAYVFLSKAYDSSPKQADEVIQAFRRYAELQPANALAQYYYAMSLWKGKRIENSGLDLHSIESLLQKAIALDDTLADAHVQLGNLYSDQREYQKALPQYTRALELNPNIGDAHYRLGTVYVHLGQKENAQKEFAVYEKLRAEHLAEVEKERAEVRQFLYSEKTGASSKPE